MERERYRLFAVKRNCTESRMQPSMMLRIYLIGL
jgi:hypothetical protein